MAPPGLQNRTGERVPMSEHWSDRVWLLPSAIIVAAGIAAQYFYLPNDDATWLFVVGRRMISGSALYSNDIVEMNLPLIMQMSAMAVRLASLFGISAMLAWRVMVACQIVFTMVLCATLLTKVLGRQEAALRTPLLAFLAWIVACLLGYDYGQREHFVIMWLLPYVIAAAGRTVGIAPSRRTATTLGIMLGLVVCLKPHYLVLILLVEVGVLAHTRTLRTTFRTETLTGAAFTVLYALSLAVLHPTLYTVGIPLAAKYYPAYGSMSLRPIHFSYIMVALAAVALTLRWCASASLSQLFFLAGAGGFAVFILQNKGWPYHFLPGKAFFMMALAIAMIAAAQTVLGMLRPSDLSTLNPTLMAAATVVVTVGALAWSAEQAWAYQSTRQARIIRNVSGFLERVAPPLPAPRRFAALSFSLFPAFPANEMLHAEWSLRMSCLWMFPGIIEHDQPAPKAGPIHEEGRRYVLNSLVEDFNRWRPNLVLVERTRQIALLEELLKDERFNQVWQRYELVGEVEYFQVYRLP